MDPRDYDFDEAFYITQNSDVAVAIANGSFSSGFDHFLRNGIGEGRSPNEKESKRRALREGALQTAITMLDRAEVDAAIEELTKLKVATGGLARQSDKSTDALILQAIGKTLVVRDAGRYMPALEVLYALSGIAHHIQITVEILFILAISLGDLSKALVHIEGLPQVNQDDPRVILLKADCLRRRFAMEQASLTLARIPTDFSFAEPFYLWLETEVAFSINCWRFKNGIVPAEIVAKRENVNAEFNDFAWVIAPWLEEHVGPHQFRIMVQRALFWELHPPVAAERICAFFAINSATLELEKRIVVFCAAVAFGYQGPANEVLKRIDSVPQFAHHPVFVKTLEFYVQRFSERHQPLLDEVLTEYFAAASCKQFLSGDLQAYDHYKLPQVITYASEICARHSHRIRETVNLKVLPQTPKIMSPTGAKSHLFIGIFGQLRFMDRCLPPLFDKLREGFKDWVSEGNKISVAISTWSKSGERLPTPYDPFGYIEPLLPDEIRNFCSARGVRDRATFEELFPTVASAIKPDANSNHAIDPARIRALCGEDVLLEIGDDEADFQTSFGAMIRTALEEQGHTNQAYIGQVLNQGRMWNRIAALSKPFVELQRSSLNTAGPIILLRPDLVFRKGSIETLVRKVVDSQDQSRVYDDADALAHFLDGIGDRYFVGTTEMMVRLFDGEKIFKAVLSDEGELGKRYRDRLIWHCLPLTLLYEHGANVQPVSRNEIDFEVYRGKRDILSLVLALEEDAQHSPDLAVRSFAHDLLAAYLKKE
jgi:hypothetical protein